jgi:antitoxin component of MazEF toxin-antitoxin module
MGVAQIQSDKTRPKRAAAKTVTRRPEITKLRPFGNSQGVIIPKSILDQIDFSQGVEVVIDGDELRLRPAVRSDDPFGFAAAVRFEVAHGMNAEFPDIIDAEDWPE